MSRDIRQGANAGESSPGDSNTETEGKELSSRLTWSRLCRLMCGRSLTFRSDRTLLRGSAPNPGAAQEKTVPTRRWGEAATAHQAGEPRRTSVGEGFYKYFAPTA